MAVFQRNHWEDEIFSIIFKTEYCSWVIFEADYDKDKQNNIILRKSSMFFDFLGNLLKIDEIRSLQYKK